MNSDHKQLYRVAGGASQRINPQACDKGACSITFWTSGLTWNHDLFVSAAARGLGYRAEPLPVPDHEALRLGKEFGNRGQCNPAYYTVGNLIKHLRRLEASGLSRQNIINDYAFITASTCGPCRFGMYLTEYRKALRDAGFEGFRVLPFLQETGLRQAAGSAGIEFNPPFFRAIFKGILAADVLNLMAYRIRPYEVELGATDAAVLRCQRVLVHALEGNRSVLRALRRCRKVLRAIRVDRLRPKPVVSVIGEFWAMTTEGEGNYELQRFLEQEGAEVSIEPVWDWLLYLLWERQRDLELRTYLRDEDEGLRGLKGKEPRKQLLLVRAGMLTARFAFKACAAAIGLKVYHLPDQAHLARIAHWYYDNEVRGGEGHMEVAKLIDSVERNQAHMVVSVKPFGCMPSSGISDGVQSLITARYPQAIFCPVETSGDSKVSVQSRIQMMLFRARQRACEEFECALDEAGISREQAARRLAKNKRVQLSGHYPRHRFACTAANLVRELA